MPANEEKFGGGGLVPCATADIAARSANADHTFVEDDEAVQFGGEALYGNASSGGGHTNSTASIEMRAAQQPPSPHRHNTTATRGGSDPQYLRYGYESDTTESTETASSESTLTTDSDVVPDEDDVLLMRHSVDSNVATCGVLRSAAVSNQMAAALAQRRRAEEDAAAKEAEATAVRSNRPLSARGNRSPRHGDKSPRSASSQQGSARQQPSSRLHGGGFSRQDAGATSQASSRSASTQRTTGSVGSKNSNWEQRLYYNSFTKYMQQKIERAQLQDVSRKRKEIEEVVLHCTFQPKITETGMYGNPARSGGGDEAFARLFCEAEHRKKHLAVAKEKQKQAELSECSFHPSTSRSPGRGGRRVAGPRSPRGYSSNEAAKECFTRLYTSPRRSHSTRKSNYETQKKREEEEWDKRRNRGKYTTTTFSRLFGEAARRDEKLSERRQDLDKQEESRMNHVGKRWTTRCRARSREDGSKGSATGSEGTSINSQQRGEDTKGSEDASKGTRQRASRRQQQHSDPYDRLYRHDRFVDRVRSDPSLAEEYREVYAHQPTTNSSRPSSPAPGRKSPPRRHHEATEEDQRVDDSCPPPCEEASGAVTSPISAERRRQSEDTHRHSHDAAQHNDDEDLEQVEQYGDDDELGVEEEGGPHVEPPVVSPKEVTPQSPARQEEDEEEDAEVIDSDESDEDVEAVVNGDYVICSDEGSPVHAGDSAQPHDEAPKSPAGVDQQEEEEGKDDNLQLLEQMEIVDEDEDDDATYRAYAERQAADGGGRQ